MAEGSNRIRSNKENMTVVTEGNDVIFSHSKQEIKTSVIQFPSLKCYPWQKLFLSFKTVCGREI